MTTIHSSGIPPAPVALRDARNGHPVEAEPVFLQDGAPEGAELERGRFPGEGRIRDIAWVQAGSGSRALLEALGETFSPALSSAVARELELAPGSVALLNEKTIDRAFGMAQTSWEALAGVDFLTALHFSAVHSGAGFRAAAAELGVDPSTLSPSVRQTLDARMKAHFEQAAATGAVPMDPAHAHDMFKKELTLLTP